MTETPPEPRSPSPHGRTYLIALLLIAAAGFGGVWALSQPWVTAVTNAGFGDEPVTVAGSTLYPLSVAGAWLGLAGAVAVIATAGIVRRVVGLLICLAAAALAVGPMAFWLSSEAVMISDSTQVTAESVSRTSWWALTALCSLAMIVAGLMVWRFGSQWRALSGRQVGSTKVAASDWELLDRGEDPTA